MMRVIRTNGASFSNRVLITLYTSAANLVRASPTLFTNVSAISRASSFKINTAIPIPAKIPNRILPQSGSLENASIPDLARFERNCITLFSISRTRRKIAMHACKTPLSEPHC